MTAFAPGRRASASTTFRRPVGRLTADPTVEVAADRRPPGSRENRRRDRIYVTRRAFGRDCTIASSSFSFSFSAVSFLPLSLSRSLSRLPRVLSVSLARASSASDRGCERERECARARYASRVSSCGSLTGTWWNRAPPNEKSETAIRSRAILYLRREDGRRESDAATFPRARQQSPGSRNPRECGLARAFHVAQRRGRNCVSLTYIGPSTRGGHRAANRSHGVV